MVQGSPRVMIGKVYRLSDRSTLALTGDWRSDCYFIYLEVTDRQKRAAATRMAAAISHIAV